MDAGGNTARDVLAQRKPQRERERGWRVRVGEEEEKRARRKAGKAAGMDGDRTGDLKGKAAPRGTPGCWGGLSPELWGLCRRWGRGRVPGEGSALILSGCRVRSDRRVLG